MVGGNTLHASGKFTPSQECFKVDLKQLTFEQVGDYSRRFGTTYLHTDPLSHPDKAVVLSDDKKSIWEYTMGVWRLMVEIV